MSLDVAHYLSLWWFFFVFCFFAKVLPSSYEILGHAVTEMHLSPTLVPCPVDPRELAPQGGAPVETVRATLPPCGHHC